MQQLITAVLSSTTTADKGRSLEDFACYIFGGIPGISITGRDARNVFQTEEIDIALWNERYRNGLHFLDMIILIECKNWSNPVGSMEVAWFDTKLRNRGLDFGILIAMNGITGDRLEINNANIIISKALGERRRIIVLDREEIFNLRSSKELVFLIKTKLSQLFVSGSSL